MAKPRLRAGAIFERLRESLWFVPGLMVLGAGAVAAALAPRSGAAPDLPLIHFLLPSTVDGARAVLQVVAASVVTVTSVVFSLTVVALQITAGNYSPRVLRTFLRDMGTQFVLGTFLATFTFSFIVLQNTRPLSVKGEPSWAPEWGFIPIPLFVAGTIFALVFFIHHVTQAIRVDLILREVLDDTMRTIDRIHPVDESSREESFDPAAVPPEALTIRAPSSGFLQTVGPEELLDVLHDLQLKACLAPSVGDHVLEGTTLAWVWGDDVTDDRRVEQAIRDAVQLGDERTMQQDVAFGVRQLVDIAVRALSPGVNDPNTAVTAIAHLEVAYGRLASRSLGVLEFRDPDGVARVFVPRPTFGEYLHITIQQIGHYGSADVMVLLRLIVMLANLKLVAIESHQEPIDKAIDRVVSEAESELRLEDDRSAVRESAKRAVERPSVVGHRTAAG
ncbi:MAG: DUF2254 domain-containing protein [Actinomycetota bacterium]|nr:DUF2254 domain-containing protein [Actinomycetota bacterium]